MGQCKCWESQTIQIEGSVLNESMNIEQDYQIQRILQPLKLYETLPLPSYYSQVNDTFEEYSPEKNIPADKIYIEFTPPLLEWPNIPNIDIYKDYPKSDQAFRFDNFVYIGQWKKFEPFGLGTFFYNDGSIYIGYSYNLNPHIYGSKHYPDGSQYEGEYLFGQHHGKGTLKNKELSFQGIWCQNIPVQGIENWIDGTCFEGEYMDGKKYGNGIMKWKNGNFYEGMFKDDQFHGFGVYKFADGFIYEGEWKNSYMHGKGKLIYPNQNYFEGNFENDIQVSGILVSFKGSEKTISDLSSNCNSGSIVKIDRPSVGRSYIEFRSVYQ